jgi:signal transduction histidine kinase
VLDGAGRIVAVNQAWEKFARDNGASALAGLGVGTDYLQVCRGASAQDEDARSALAGLEAVLAGTLPAFELEYPCHAPQEQRWFHMTAVPRSEGGRNGLVVTHLDISARKRAEQRLLDLNEQLESLLKERTAQSEQRAVQLRILADELTRAETRERERLASVLHDELQPLLVGCRLGLSILDEATPRQEVDAALTSTVHHLAEAQRIARTLNVQLHPPMLDTEGLGAALRWLGRWKSKTLLLKVHVDADPNAEPRNPTTRTLLYRSVRELILNAAKHARAEEVYVAMGRIPGRVQITVEDTGAGFDVAAWDRGESMGSGLRAIRRRLGMIGGGLEIDSTPGHGTTVLLEAPLEGVSSVPARGEPPAKQAAADAQAPRPLEDFSPPAPPCPRPQGAALRVLLVDDHQTMRRNLRAVLEAQGDMIVVGEAGDGSAALEEVRALRPDVVVMDIDMPGMDGVEATRRIVQEQPGVAVIGLSMHDEDAFGAAIRKAGGRSYLSKTVSGPQLLAEIRACQATA